MKKIINLCFTSLFFAVFIFEVRADVRLPAIFGDNMVLQQQSQVAVWGWAKPNANVSVAGSWSKKRTTLKAMRKVSGG